MKKLLLVFTLATMGITLFAQTKPANPNVKSLTSGKVSFHSATPVEDIDAVSTKMAGRLDLEKRTYVIIIKNTNFQFKNSLMQEHFNEKYMESPKYPESIFLGKINENIDLTKDGEYTGTATGKLKIHGVEQDRTIPVKIVVKGGSVQVVSEFKVKVVDHKIEIPTLVVAKIAEEITVKVDLTF